jgi:putrescine aminotransferase
MTPAATAPVAAVERGSDAGLAQVQARLQRNPNDAAAYAELGYGLLQQVRETGDVSLYARAGVALDQALLRDPQQLDALAGLWCVNVGYGREEIADAVAAQMRDVAYYPSFFNTTTEPAIRLAAKLAEHAPAHLQHSIFSNSGSEANETALKLIRAYWKLRGKRDKTKVLARSFAYHGVGIATTSLTGLASCTDPFDLPLPGFLHVPGPNSFGSDKSPEEYGAWCIAETKKMIEREVAATIAALFVEPVQGAGGVIVPPAGYLSALRELCRRHEILFVADEVITAFGRLGAWFASVLWELEPDLLTTA